MKFSTLFLVMALTGCAEVIQLNRDLNASTAQLMGTFTAPVLSGSFRPSGCRDTDCLILDKVEEDGYAAIARRQLSYLNLVDTFYEERRRLYPNTRDAQWVYEYKSFQRSLAVHVDSGKVLPTEWEYLIEKKYSEIMERLRTRRTVCTTSNVGTSVFPEYKTVCRQ